MPFLISSSLLYFFEEAEILGGCNVGLAGCVQSRDWCVWWLWTELPGDRVSAWASPWACCSLLMQIGALVLECHCIQQGSSLLLNVCEQEDVPGWAGACAFRAQLHLLQAGRVHIPSGDHGPWSKGCTQGRDRALWAGRAHPLPVFHLP